MKLKDLINERLESGVSISKLSKNCNVSRPTIYRVLNDGKVGLLATQRICNYFKVNFRDYI